jgi:hypothetical protein
METAQGITDFVRLPGVFDGVEGPGGVNKAQRSPE